MNRHFVTRYFATVVALLLASLHCHSSTPLMDSIEYDGQTTIAWPDDKPWFDLPANEKLTELRRTQRCSAIGGPRAKWRLENGRLWLIGLFVCGRDIPLENVFVSPQPILATWITGNLLTHKGRLLCRDYYGPGIYETTVVLRIENGVLLDVTEKSNKAHPAVPTVDDLRKIFRRSGSGAEEAEKIAKEIVATSYWDCISPAPQAELPGHSIPNLPLPKDASSRSGLRP